MGKSGETQGIRFLDYKARDAQGGIGTITPGCRMIGASNMNPRFENYDIDDNVEICDYYERMFTEIFSVLPPGLGIGNPASWKGFVEATDDSAEDTMGNFWESNRIA